MFYQLKDKGIHWHLSKWWRRLFPRTLSKQYSRSAEKPNAQIQSGTEICIYAQIGISFAQIFSFICAK